MPVPNPAVDSATIAAAETNANNAYLEQLALSIPAGALVGGITAEKLADRFAVDWDTIMVLPYTSGADLSTPAGFVLNTTALRAAFTRVLNRPGFQSFLCGYLVHVQEADTGAGTDGWNFDVRRASSEVIGNQGAVSGSLDNQIYLVGNTDPYAAPLTALDDGDDLELRIWGPSGTPEPRGVEWTLIYKHVLVG